MTKGVNTGNPKRRINWNRGGVLDASIKEQQQVYNTTHLSTKMHPWLECDKVRIGTAARDHPEDGDSSSHSQAAIAQEEPNQAIQNKHLRCLLDQIRICVCHCATFCSHALCCVMHGKMSLCWPLCLCAGLLFLAFRPHPKCSPPLLAAAAQW
jgi:hypothetical protein